jgi:hypothetical protein
MLSPVGTSTTRFEARCDGCLASSPIFDGTREDAEARLRDLGWELRDATTWCIACQRRAREVKQSARVRRR